MHVSSNEDPVETKAKGQLTINFTLQTAQMQLKFHKISHDVCVLKEG